MEPSRLLEIIGMLVSVASFTLMVMTLMNRKGLCTQRFKCRLVKLGSIVAGTIALLSLLGQVLQSEKLHHWFGTVGMAVNTAVCIILLSLGLGWAADVIEHGIEKAKADKPDNQEDSDI